jgi:hypothetical protein
MSQATSAISPSSTRWDSLTELDATDERGGGGSRSPTTELVATDERTS